MKPRRLQPEPRLLSSRGRGHRVIGAWSASAREHSPLREDVDVREAEAFPDEGG